MPEKKKTGLSEYEEKRQFQQTPEPGPEIPPERNGPLLFVIQKHAATRLHYDLRLEVGGVLKSWACPKGISFDPKDKHLAVEVEDHPFDYASFEGVIPKGNYGAGEVIVWDVGTYWCDEDDEYVFENREDAERKILQELEKGKLSFFMRGHKMKGSFALVRMKDAPNWLIIKHNDRWAKMVEDITEQDHSVLSGLTIEDLKKGEKPGPRWKPERMIPHGTFEKFPSKIKPMAAQVADAPFDDPDWVFEPKLDGIRAVTYMQGDEMRIMTRNGLDQTSQFPELVRHLKDQHARQMVLDGEIVAFEDGKAGFNAMLKRFHLKDRLALEQADKIHPCVYYVFDILHFEGIDTRSLSQKERRRLLEQVLLPTDRIQLTTTVEEAGETLYTAVLGAGFEGIMAKKADSRYDTSGKRSRCWLKVKGTSTTECVVGGYLKGEGGRSSLVGSLYLGFYEDGKLVFTGNVGSGFSVDALNYVTEKLNGLKTDKHPFETKPPNFGPTVWVKPEIVVEVKYSDITPEGMLRHPVFLREREDLDPKEITRPMKSVHVETEVEHKDEKPKKKGGMPPLVEAVLAQLEGNEKKLILQVGEHEVSLTSLDKVYWPENKERGLAAFTKRDYIRYLAKVSPFMLPHLLNRPLTMIRFPEGIHGEKFFQKHWDQKRPEYVETIQLYSGSNDVDQSYINCTNLPTLLWLGQLGTLEFHVWASRSVPGPDGFDLPLTFTGSEDNIEASLLNFPDYIEFDLDPYIYSGKEKKGEEPELHHEGFEQAKKVAFWFKEMLNQVGVDLFVKTTGKTGLHVFAPIVRNLDFGAVRAICETFSRALEAQHPKELTTEWKVEKRTGKVFLDYNMNVRSKTLGVAYCPRALPNQSIAMPVTWDELPKVYPEDFTMTNVFDRLYSKGDVWANILDAKKDLQQVIGG